MSEKMKEVPGTYFPSSDFKTDKVLSFHWRPNAKYAWSAGVAYSKFLEELKNASWYDGILQTTALPGPWPDPLDKIFIGIRGMELHQL